MTKRGNHASGVTGYETGTGSKSIKTRTLIFHVFLVVFALAATEILHPASAMANEQPGLKAPEITEDSIVFSNGSVIHYTPEKIFAPENEDWKNPTWHSSTTQKTYLIPHWERVVLVTREIYYEGDQLILELFDFSGKKIRTIEKLYDSSELLVEHAGRIVVVMSGPYMTTNQCTIFNTDGTKIWSKEYDDIITRYDQTEDQELWWIVLLGGRINVFNGDGNLVDEKQYVKGRPTDVQYQGKAYQIYGDQN